MWHYILETEDYYASLAISPDPENFHDSDMCFSMGSTPTDEQGAMFAEALNVHEATGLTPAQLQARVAELEASSHNYFEERNQARETVRGYQAEAGPLRAALSALVQEYEGYFEGAPEPKSLIAARKVLGS